MTRFEIRNEIREWNRKKVSVKKILLTSKTKYFYLNYILKIKEEFKNLDKSKL